MDKEKIEKALDKALNKPDAKEVKKTSIKTNNDLIEHVDKKLVLEDGRELLL